MTTIVAALFLSLGVFSADAIKHQHSKTKSAGEASPTAVEMEETTTTKEHLLDPALNTDEVRDAAKQVGHITDMDAYLAAIEHKMDVLAEHPAHNVREDIRDIKLGPRGAFVTSRPQFFLSSSFGRLFSERRECLFLFACTGLSFFVFYPSFVVYVVRSMIFRAFTDDDDDDDDGALACFLPRDRNVTKILTVSADF
jgi:hypothetical protein